MSLIPKILIGLALLAAGYVGYLYFSNPHIPSVQIEPIVINTEDGKKSFYLKDLHYVYYVSTSTDDVILYADPSTFVAVSQFFGKDIQFVYVGDKIIPEADSPTFIADGNYAAHDKKHTYEYRGSELYRDGKEFLLAP